MKCPPADEQLNGLGFSSTKRDNLFVTATQIKFRFQSVQGKLSVEDLRDLPLRSGRASLDDVAITLNKALKAATEESFVEEAAPEASTRSCTG